MRLEPPQFDKLSQMASIDVGRLTENEARAILEEIRWPEKITCIYCNSPKITYIVGKSKNVRDGVLQCRKCRQQFTVTVGTVMQGSHITLRQWVQAFYSMCSHKKGISALQLQRNLGLGSYRSAWHLAHRIRLAMQNNSLVLSGTVEVDETYVGGKPRDDGKYHKRGRGTDKAPVMVLVERGGRSISKPIEKVNAKTLKGAIKEGVNKKSTIMTDEWASYTGIGKDFKGGHQVVNHGQGEYARGAANTNTAESYFALLKRGVHGTFHHVSKKHLGRYCDEFSFRWNHREVSDGERTVEAIKGMLGKRLAYKS
jgi:transposase-like protein